MAKRVAVYLRVSTDGQNTENQYRELAKACEVRGWKFAETYEDHGISGAKGRDKRPEFDRLIKDAVRGKFDVVAAWSVDRLGRSLQDLIHFLGEVQGAGVDLYLHQQAVDTTTPAGRAMFQMMGVFAEFERAMIRDRVNAGLARAREKGKRFGRPPVSQERLAAARELLKGGMGMVKVGKTLGLGTSVVQELRARMVQEGALS